MGIESPKRDSVLWGLVFVILASAVVGNFYFSEKSLLIRVVFGLIAAVSVIAAAYKTTKGQQLWMLWQEAVQEVRRIYWPTRQETMQTTLAVLAMVLVMGIILWTTDFLLIRAIGWLTGHWGV